MIFAALNEAAGRNQLLLVDGGMCRFHKRKDAVVVIREVLVLPQHRRQGIGREMISEVASRHPGAVLRALCPVAYESNAFWAACGFCLLEWGEKVATWERQPSSSVPTVLPPSPARP